MNREAGQNRVDYRLLALLGLVILCARPALSQVPVDENGDPIAAIGEGATAETFDDEEIPALSVSELEDVVGPVALYPDDLLAIVLPASTYPLQVVQAARFLEQLEQDPTLEPDEEWDESITALLNYPEVVKLMNDDIDWTWRLGEAVVAQQSDVIAAIELFRDKAYAAGNLKSDEHQTVSNEDGVIEIEPAEEDVIYVPYYEPEHVVVYQPRPVYHYYPRAYPVYYYPYPYGYSFASGYFWGVTSAFTIGWLTDHLHVHHHSYWGHPYYGHYYPTYYYYRRPSLSIHNSYYVINSRSHWNHRFRDGDYWRPRRHGGARPGHHSRRVHYYRDRNRDDWRHRRGDRRRDDTLNHQRGNEGTWAGNRNQERRGGDRRRGGDGDRNGSNPRDRRNPGDVNDTSGSGPRESNTIRFRSRDARVRADAERRRTRATEDLRRPARRTSFAPSPGTSSSANPRSRTGSSAGTSHRRDRTVAVNRPQVAPSRQARSTAPRIRQSSNRPAPARSQAQGSAAPRSAPRASAPRSSASPARRAESRSSGSRGSSGRNDRGSRRRH